MRKEFLTHFVLFIVSILCILFSYVGYSHALPLPARLSANGYASDFAVGQADLMLPLKGDRTHNFYLDPNASYASNSQSYTDLGG